MSAGPRLSSPAAMASAVRDEARVQGWAAAADVQLARLARSGKTIVAGPWLSEVGFEVLYWIPLLRHLAERHGIGAERMVAVTRGGAGSWYGGLAGRTIDAFSIVSPGDLRSAQERRATQTGAQKQLGEHDLDRRLLDHVRSVLGDEPHVVLHPSLMYRLLAAFWARRRPIGFVERRSAYRPYARPALAPDTEGPLRDLPADYVAVKAYFSDCFPATDDNRAWLAGTLATLAERVPVVLLSTGIAVDDHVDYGHAAQAGRIITIEEAMGPTDNLAVQSHVIAGARALLSTYGGFSYLGPFLGVSSFTFFSHENFNPTHLDVMARVARSLRAQGADAGFVAFDVREAHLLKGLLTGSPRGVAA